MLDQIIKGACISLHGATLLAQENSDLHTANQKIRQKRTRSKQQIVHEGGLTVEEGLQLVQQLNQPIKDTPVVAQPQGDEAIQLAQPATRAPPRCSGCRGIGHKINQCKNRQI